MDELITRLLNLFTELHKLFYGSSLIKESSTQRILRHPYGLITMIETVEQVPEPSALKNAAMIHIDKNNVKNYTDLKDTHIFFINKAMILTILPKSAISDSIETQECFMIPAIIHEFRHMTQEDNKNLRLRKIEALNMLMDTNVEATQLIAGWVDSYQNFYKPGYMECFAHIDEETRNQMMAQEEDAFTTQYIADFLWLASSREPREQRLEILKQVLFT